MAKNKALGTVLFLVCSGAAFAAAIYIETVPAWAGVVGGDKKADEASPPASKAPAPPLPSKRRAPPPPAGTGSSRPRSLSLTDTIEPSRSQAPAPEAAPPASALSVPDWKGKRLSIARREARALGITILARDDEGQRVSSDVAPYYRVRRQLTLAGAAVAPGATVEVRVRDAETPSGY